MRDATILMDGQYYQRMRFENCLLVYQGGEVPILVDNEFVSCQWRVDGPALNSLDFFRLLVEIGGRDMVLTSLGLPNG